MPYRLAEFAPGHQHAAMVKVPQRERPDRARGVRCGRVAVTDGEPVLLACAADRMPVPAQQLQQVEQAFRARQGGALQRGRRRALARPQRRACTGRRTGTIPEVPPSSTACR
jgi:hypothetical protein